MLFDPIYFFPHRCYYYERDYKHFAGCGKKTGVLIFNFIYYHRRKLLVPTVVLTGGPSKTEPVSSSYGRLSEGVLTPVSKGLLNTPVLVPVNLGLH